MSSWVDEEDMRKTLEQCVRVDDVSSGWLDDVMDDK